MNVTRVELTDRISESFAGLSPQLRIAARHVLDNPDDVALLSMRQLAGRAGVKPSTMVRLAREFDFESFREFQEPFQSPFRYAPGGYLEKARGLQSRSEGDHRKGLIAEIIETDASNLHRAFQETGAETIVRSAGLLASARRIFVLGLRSCHPVAYAFHYASRLFAQNTVLLGGAGTEVGDELRLMEQGDALLAVSFEPYTRETVRAVHYAKDHGGKVVAITDSRVSPLATAADETLLMAIGGPSFFPSVASGMTLAQALVAVMAAEGGDTALKSIAESEEQLAAFDAYWPLSGAETVSGRRA